MILSHVMRLNTVSAEYFWEGHYKIGILGNKNGGGVEGRGAFTMSNITGKLQDDKENEK